MLSNRKEPTKKSLRRITKAKTTEEQTYRSDDDRRRASLDTNDQSFESLYSISNVSVDSRSSVAALDLECDESMDDFSSSNFETELIRMSPFDSFSPGSHESPFKRHLRWNLSSDDYVEKLLETEAVYSCDPNLMLRGQPNITPVMRAILVDWMMEACTEFTFKRETFHYSVSHVDRFLSLQPGVLKEQFQLVGLVAIYIAAKTEVT